MTHSKYEPENVTFYLKCPWWPLEWNPGSFWLRSTSQSFPGLSPLRRTESSRQGLFCSVCHWSHVSGTQWELSNCWLTVWLVLLLPRPFWFLVWHWTRDPSLTLRFQCSDQRLIVLQWYLWWIHSFENINSTYVCYDTLRGTTTG